MSACGAHRPVSKLSHLSSVRPFRAAALAGLKPRTYG